MLYRILGLLFLASVSMAVPRPNVLFIAIDDLNDWIGCLNGHPQALTPNMDRLAKRGVLFRNAHCAAPACSPSRAAVFTGLMPQNNGVWANRQPKLEKKYRDPFLLPMSFKAAGYRTLGTGKLLHSKGKAAFEDYFRTEQRWSPITKDAANYTKDELPSKGTDQPRHIVRHRNQTYILPLNRMPSDRRPIESGGESFDWGPWDAPDSDFGDTLITDWAIEKLRQPTDEPLFLGVGFYRPHQPLYAPTRFFDRFRNDPGKLPPILRNDLDDLSSIAKQWALEPITSGAHSTVVKFKQWRSAIEAYLACVTYVDHEIGRLLDTLDRSTYADNTVVVLWSDHGWQLGEKEHWGKWTGWERSTRVPLIIVPPKHAAFAKDKVCDDPVNLIDLYPTLVELCRVPAPKHQFDGRSLVPNLKQPSRLTGRTSLTMFNPGNCSLRTDRWRYIQYNEGSEELYDLKDDPNEWHNLAAKPKYAETKRGLAKRLSERLATLQGQ
ncbi:MAG: sulfatase [Limisphaerales bacterium]